jgi:cytochrome c oxidase assembly protein subunit 15
MGDFWIPPDINELVPWERNLIENTATVQFNHRLLGSATAATALGIAAVGLSPAKSALLTPQARKGLLVIGLAASAQFTLGVTTLLHYVPLSLAAAHQLGSVVVFTSAVYSVHALRYARPALIRAAQSIKHV